MQSSMLKRAWLPILLLAFVAVLPPAQAGGGGIAYFSVSLVHHKTRKLTPIVIFTNDVFTYRRPVDIPFGSSFFVKVRAAKGRYLSACFRDDSSRIYDLPLHARRITSDSKEFVWTMPRRFMQGDVEFFLCLWASYNPDTLFMEGRVHQTQWIKLGETAY